MLAGAIARFDEAESFRGVHDHWLLQQDIQARFQAELGLVVMQVMRRDDEDGIQLGAEFVQHGGEARLVGRRRRPELCQLGGGEFIVVPRWLADDADISASFDHEGQVVARHAARADQGSSGSHSNSLWVS